MRAKPGSKAEPKDNRSIPPLDYGLVHALKRTHPDWPIVLNGGLSDLENARPHLQKLDGLMLAAPPIRIRSCCIGIDLSFSASRRRSPNSFEAIEAFMPIIALGLERGERLHDYTRHLHGLFAGRPGARAFRQALATEAVKRGAGLEVLWNAIRLVSREAPALSSNEPSSLSGN